MSLGLTAPTPEEPPVAVSGTRFGCITCGARFTPFEDVRYTYSNCDDLLEVRYAPLPTQGDFEDRDAWRYDIALPFEKGISLLEGTTPLHGISRLEANVGVKTLHVKYEGMNPTGSFKGHGMTVDIRVVEELGVGRLAYTSTDNIPAALTVCGAHDGMETLMLLPVGKAIAREIVQASFHDAHILEVNDSFDSCLGIVQDLAVRSGAYLFDSPNPFHLEGQKTIGLEILGGFRENYDSYPDRVVLPVDNVGNTSASYKVFHELTQSGASDVDGAPKLVGVQAEDAASMVGTTENGWGETRRWDDVKTHATAIRVDNPINAPKALPGIRETGGTATAVSDEEIIVAQHNLTTEGIDVKLTSTTPVTGLRKLHARGVVNTDEQAIYPMTSRLLKGPDVVFEADDDPGPVPNDTETVFEHLAR